MLKILKKLKHRNYWKSGKKKQEFEQRLSEIIDARKTVLPQAM